ncbi:protein kinase, partial [Achlya hypogyna]
PYFAWRLLLADTEHWRGLGQRACCLHVKFTHQFPVSEITSAEGLHVLIEMHRKHIVDFAHLNLEQRIGVGASAAVYRGTLRSKTPVAIKVYTPKEINDDVVAAFSHEAALCGALNHPNVVTFHGMCVCPPTICLVSELCRGSVADYLAARPLDAEPLQQVAVDVCLLLDAARAVAYLHSFSPPFIHRDLKPGNLLLDAGNRVKLTDFGDSRASEDDTRCDALRKMSVRGTVEYMAPEVINGKAGLAQYSVAADIYSLGITFWDVLHPTATKYPGAHHHHLRVFERVLDGARPALRPDLHPTLARLLGAAWAAAPEARPSAAKVVSMLEAVQDDVLGPLALDLSKAATYVGGGKDHFVEGAHLVDCMLDMDWVSDAFEAVRVGAALMDAGFLHHAKHARGFENGPSLYSFDEDAIDASVPLVLSSRDTVTVSSSKDTLQPARCACQQFAQGLKQTKQVHSSVQSMLTVKDQPLTLKLLEDDFIATSDSGA